MNVTAASASPAAPLLSQGIASAYDSGVAALRAHPAVTEIAAGAGDDAIAQPGVTHLFTTPAESFLTDESLGSEVFGSTSLVVLVPDAGMLPDLLDRLEGQLTAVKEAVRGHGGPAPVVVELLTPQFGIVQVLAGDDYRVKITTALIEKLERLLGTDRVAVS